MSEVQTKIDAYFDGLPDGRRQLCQHLRQLIHSVHPEIVESWKWRAPVFELSGLLCWVVNFKHHVGLNFFRGSVIADRYNHFEPVDGGDKQNRLITITPGNVIPDEQLRYYLAEAVRVNESGLRPVRTSKVLVIPNELSAALTQHPEAAAFFETLAPSHRREYVEHVATAKRPETRQRRTAKVIEQLLAKRRLNDQYR